MKLACLLALLLAFGAHISQCARILGVFPYHGKSHSFVINAILRELIERGHELDVITVYPLPENTPNYTAIDVSPGYNFWPDVMRHFGIKSLSQMGAATISQSKEGYSLLGQLTSDYALKHPNMQSFLHSTNHKQYDLMLYEQYYQDAFLMLSHQFQVPVVAIATFGWNSYFTSMFGNFGAWSHVPHELYLVPDAMNFWQRSRNVFYGLCDKYIRHCKHLPRQQALADKYFAHLPEPRPTIEELSRSVSVILQNSYVPMSPIKPTVPGIVDVGGIHIVPPKPLPNDLQEFLDQATQGAIYFSFGTHVKSKDIPPAEMAAILQVFNELSDIKILWKWDSEQVDHMPKNVLTRKWLPQIDILAHPNVKLFISHAGLMGVQEAIYHGVPMLSIPIHTDHHTVAYRSEMQGYSLKLDLKNITVDSLRWAIAELLYNPTYAKKIEEYSRVFRERPESPMETAMFWIEYVAKFRGAEHLRSVGRDLTWYSYLLLDVVAAVTLTIVVVMIGLWLAIKTIFAKIKQFQLPHAKNKCDKKYE